MAAPSWNATVGITSRTPLPSPGSGRIGQRMTEHKGAVRTVRWEDLEDRDHRCPQCLHWWVSHGVPTEDDYACSMPASSMDERERGVYKVCGCTFAESNPVTPRQVRIWTDGTSWERADCSHSRRGPIRPDDSQQCLDCGV